MRRLSFGVTLLMLLLLAPAVAERVASSGALGTTHSGASTQQYVGACAVSPSSGLPGQTLPMSISIMGPPPVVNLLLLFPVELHAESISFLPGGIQGALTDYQFINMPVPTARFSGTFTIDSQARLGPRTILLRPFPPPSTVEILCVQAFTVDDPIQIPETNVSPASGGTVTDPRTGASTTIPRNTLKVNTRVRIVVLDSADYVARVDNSCDVPLSPDDVFPAVPGFERVTDVMRIEGRPCGSNAYGPGMTVKLPVLSQYRARFPRGTPLQLFQLGRSPGGDLVFLDTGIRAKVDPGGSGTSFAVVPNIQVFGTLAAFLPIRSQGFQQADLRFHIESSQQTAISTLNSSGVTSLFFPVIDQTNGRVTRLSIVNLDPKNLLSVTLLAYDALGDQHGVAVRAIPSARQASFLVADLFPGFQRGAIVAQAQGPMTGYFEIADSFANPTMWATAEAVTVPQSALVLPIVEATSQAYTEVHIFNPNPEPLVIRLRAFDRSRRPVDPTSSNGQKIETIQIPPSGKLMASSSRLTPSSPGVTIPFSHLDGGYILMSSLDESRKFVAAELVGETRANRTSLTVMHGLPLPSGCVLVNPGDPACRGDQSPASPIPAAAKQHTLYAPYFEDSPARADVIVVNVSDAVAQVAFSAFREDGSFRDTWPNTGFRNLQPNEVLRMSAVDLFGFNPAPGYVRIEDPASAIVGVVINRDQASNRYKTVLPFVPDVPQLTQINSDSFLSRLQLDPASANPRLTTGLIIFNPNNNSLAMTIAITSADGQANSAQTVVSRGVFTRVRNSLSVLFPSSRAGYVEVVSTNQLDPGEGGRLIVVGVYRSLTTNSISSVMEQSKSP